MRLLHASYNRLDCRRHGPVSVTWCAVGWGTLLIIAGLLPVAPISGAARRWEQLPPHARVLGDFHSQRPFADEILNRVGNTNDTWMVQHQVVSFLSRHVKATYLCQY